MSSAAHVDGDGPPVRIERRPECADARGPIAVANAQILFTRPQELHRPSVERLGDTQHLSDLQSARRSPSPASTEPAADKCRMHIDVLGRNPTELRYLSKGSVGDLIAAPQLCA